MLEVNARTSAANARSKINLFFGDCMDDLRDIPDNYYDLAPVDPPYYDGPNKLGYYGARISRDGVHCKEYKKIGSWDVPDEKYFKELCRVSKHQIIWGINYYNIKNLGAGRIVWDKVNGKSSFSDCEIAYNSTNDRTDLFSFMWNGMMQAINVEDGKTQQGNKKLNEKRIHPTQKPVALYRWLLEKYAKPGYKILDTHGGSMSSVIACIEAGFDIDIWEKDKEIFNNAVKRIKNHTAQLNMFRSEPEIYIHAA